MFTTNHFIWLGATLIYIIGLLFLQKFKKFNFKIIINYVFFTCLICELIKIFSNMKETDAGGTVLDPADLPFHLCSIQIFFLFVLKLGIKNEVVKERLLAFMAPTMIVGGLLALLIPTVGVKFTKPQVYEYFVFHATIIAFSIYVLKERLVNYNWSYFWKNLSFLGVMALIATWINSALSVTNPKVNFFYLCRPPMDNLPILNLNNGWVVYVITLAVFAVIFMVLFHLIVITIYKKRPKY